MRIMLARLQVQGEGLHHQKVSRTTPRRRQSLTCRLPTIQKVNLCARPGSSTPALGWIMEMRYADKHTHLECNSDVSPIRIRNFLPDLAVPTATKDDGRTNRLRYKTRSLEVRLLEVDIPPVLTDPPFVPVAYVQVGESFR